ncbi:MAG TPA: Arc family DNA-binding protein, partial [Gemmataceae bacterium]|nr:Arc family DNA-binding protein [Gemmataceae bacterium]
MARKDVKPFLLRIDPAVLAAVQKWAEEDLRSLNGQIEYILRQALAKRGVKLPEGEKGNDEKG